jgi:hypothetical protein
MLRGGWHECSDWNEAFFTLLCIALPGWQMGGQVVNSAQQSDDI